MKWRTKYPELHSCAELVRFVDEVGFLPLLGIGMAGIGHWSADAVVDEDCRYKPSPDGGMDWPLWEWKGDVIKESGCAYGKFFRGKAGFVSKAWWPDFCNWRRSLHPRPAEGSVEESILLTLGEGGSMITRDLRAACGFAGTRMRSRFDGYVARLQMGGYIVTEDFVYPRDRHGRPYGWGWALLATAERQMGHDACHIRRSPEESRRRVMAHFRKLLPDASELLLHRLLR